MKKLVLCCVAVLFLASCASTPKRQPQVQSRTSLPPPAASEPSPECNNFDDRYHSCRAPEKDSWCGTHSTKPYAYRNEGCNETHPWALEWDPSWPDNCIPLLRESLGRANAKMLVDSGPGSALSRNRCFVIRATEKWQGVVTLRNGTPSSDWDIYLGTGFDPATGRLTGLFNNTRNRGSSAEIAWLPTRDQDVFLILVPVANSASRACLTLHFFDSNEILGKALVLATIQYGLTEMLSPNGASQETKNNVGRAVAGGMSALQRTDIAGVGYDMVMNEISTQLANAFGGGSWLFTFGVNYFSGYLEESTKYLFGRDSPCTSSSASGT